MFTKSTSIVSPSVRGSKSISDCRLASPAILNEASLLIVSVMFTFTACVKASISDWRFSSPAILSETSWAIAESKLDCNWASPAALLFNSLSKSDRTSSTYCLLAASPACCGVGRFPTVVVPLESKFVVNIISEPP